MRPLILLGLLCCLAGSAAIRGPKAVSGHVGGSLTVTCYYDSGYETYVKWWCRGASGISCTVLANTDGTEQVVRKDRLAVRDDQSHRRVTVTMEQLRVGDMDTYWCGIQRTGVDLEHRVIVGVCPAPPKVLTTMNTNAINVRNAPMTPAIPEETTDIPDVTSAPHNAPQAFSVLPLLPVISAVFLFLLLAASLLAWRKWKRQRTASGVSPESVRVPGSQPTPLPLSSPDLGPGCPDKRRGADAREEVCYARLSLHPCELEPTYANMDPDVAPRASRSPEVTTEYSSIRKPKAGSETPTPACTPVDPPRPAPLEANTQRAQQCQEDGEPQVDMAEGDSDEKCVASQHL